MSKALYANFGVKNSILILLLGASPYSAYTFDFVLFDENESNSFRYMCSRENIEDVSGTWTVSDNLANKVMGRLEEVEGTSTSLCCNNGPIENLDEYFYQLGGVVSKGRNIVYVKATSKSSIDFREKYLSEYVIACDGGDWFWGIEFDPKTNQFMKLAINATF